MKKLLYIILSISILTSCNKTNQFDGVWLLIYNDFEDYKIEPSNQKTLLEFDGDLVYTIKIGDLETGDLKTMKIDTATYSFNNSTLQIGEEKIDIIYSHDSIIFINEDTPQTKTVAKRLKSNLKNIDINTNVLDGSYFISGKNYNDTIDFINDSTLIFTGNYNLNYPVRKWNIINYSDFKFFNIQHMLFPLLIFKSQTDKKIILEYTSHKGLEYDLTKINTPTLSYNLIGNWHETKINAPKPMPPIFNIKEGDQYYYLSFTEDSLLINHFGRNEKIRWSLSGDNQRIYFIDKIFADQSSWKILELTKDNLTLRISKNSGLNEEIVYLKKENNRR